MQIDLNGIADKAAFERSMVEHFQFDVGKNEFWQLLWHAFTQLPGQGRITFYSWAEFEKRMPRYARRLRRMLNDHQDVVKSDSFRIDYL